MTYGDLSDLTIGYSSLSDRLAAIPVRSDLGGAHQVVVVQTGSADDAGALPEESARQIDRLQRSGAEVRVLHSSGVARSRNEVLRRAGTRFVLFCDDDVSVDLAGVARVIEHLRRSGAAMALARAVDETGALRKAYATETMVLTMLTAAKAATYEMVVDVAQLSDADVWFDERFGAGETWFLGDEYIFIADLLRAGLDAQAVPITIAMHPADSSGARWGAGGDLPARAAAIERAFRSRAILPKLGFAVKNVRRMPGLGAVASFVVRRHGPHV